MRREKKKIPPKQRIAPRACKQILVNTLQFQIPFLKFVKYPYYILYE